jgi:hypothetical protein
VLRRSPALRELLLKGCMRRARALELAGNSAHAAEVQLDCYDGCARNLPPDVMGELRRLLALRHPDRLSQAQLKLDWSLAAAGRWALRKAPGHLPAAVRNFGCAYHRAGNRVFVVGGQHMPAEQLGGRCPPDSSEVHCLELGSWAWRRAPFRGSFPRDELPGLRLYSTAVWRSSIVCYVGGPALYLFDMEREAWSRRSIAWPRCVAAQRAQRCCSSQGGEEEGPAAWASSGSTQQAPELCARLPAGRSPAGGCRRFRSRSA